MWDNYFSIGVMVTTPDAGEYAAVVFGIAPSKEIRKKVTKFVIPRLSLLRPAGDKGVQSVLDKLCRLVTKKFDVECYGTAVDAVSEIRYTVEQEEGEDQ